MPIPRWTQNAMDRLGRAVSWVERQPRFRRQPRARWHRHPQFKLVAIQLAEDHPGRGIVFDVWLGTEDEATHGWTYDHSETFDCIDWRCCESCGLPYPDKCATGFAFWRDDGVLEIIDLDCCAPDDDYYCSGGNGSGS